MSPSRIGFPPIRACLFDMDGLLIDTEDLYTACNNVILHEYGRPSLPWKIKALIQGRPGPESREIFRAWAQLPLTHSELASRQAALQRKIFPSAQPLPGITTLLHTLSENNIHMALASSSNLVNFTHKTTHLPHVFSYFTPSRRILGDDPRIRPGKGKPAPDIYLLALEAINREIRAEGKEMEISPDECLVFEDSVTGVEAGRKAGMRVVWCPHPELLKIRKGQEKEILAGLTGSQFPGSLKGTREDQSPGRIDDGWGELFESLVGFPFAKYGITMDDEY